MNITLSADKKLIEDVRKYAKKKNTSINNLIRDLLSKIVNTSDVNADADEFGNLALNNSGKSDKEYKFNRNEIYLRGNKI